MGNKTIDARDMACPKPLILTKRALSESADGETITVLINDEISKNNVERFLKDNGLTPQTAFDNGVFSVTFTAGETCGCQITPANMTISITSDTMGRGNDELGRLLIQGFVNTIRELNPLPDTIIFYNTGVKLAANNSPVEQSLKELEDKGVKIIVCGTCVNFFGIADEIAVGEISNMYTIMEKLAAADRLVTP